MTYFAAALARTENGWAGVELDLDEHDSLESVVEALRELTGDGPGPGLLLLEEDDEHLVVVRADGGPDATTDPLVFVSDERAVELSGVTKMLWEDEEPVEDEDEDGEREPDESTGAVLATPVGDTSLLSDLGTPADELLRLCAEKGLLPADVITELCERAGCLDELDALRD